VQDIVKSAPIVQFHRHFYWRNHLCLVFDLLGKTLHQTVVDTRFEGLRLDTVRYVAVQLLAALQIFRELNLIHGDLKASSWAAGDASDCHILPQQLQSYPASRPLPFFPPSPLFQHTCPTGSRKISCSVLDAPGRSPLSTSGPAASPTKRCTLTSRVDFTDRRRSFLGCHMTTRLICGAWAVCSRSCTSASRCFLAAAKSSR